MTVEELLAQLIAEGVPNDAKVYIYTSDINSSGDLESISYDYQENQVNLYTH